MILRKEFVRKPWIIILVYAFCRGPFKAIEMYRFIKDLKKVHTDSIQADLDEERERMGKWFPCVHDIPKTK